MSNSSKGGRVPEAREALNNALENYEYDGNIHRLVGRL